MLYTVEKMFHISVSVLNEKLLFFAGFIIRNLCFSFICNYNYFFCSLQKRSLVIVTNKSMISFERFEAIAPQLIANSVGI